MATNDLFLLQRNASNVFTERTIVPGTDSVLTFGSDGLPVTVSKSSILVGAQGSTGSQGPQGDAGATGSQGPQGHQGDTGSQGPQGNTGSQGNQGNQGDTGSQGPQGYQGYQGNNGGLTLGSVPGSATATGSAGTIAYDTSYLYICVATDTWRRTAIATW